MAVASGQSYASAAAAVLAPSLPVDTFACPQQHSNLAMGISSPSVPLVDDSDDDEYDYVSSLVEQIARAMLDDDEMSVLKEGHIERTAMAKCFTQHSAAHPLTPDNQATSQGIWSSAKSGFTSIPQARFVPLYSNDVHVPCYPQRQQLGERKQLVRIGNAQLEQRYALKSDASAARAWDSPTHVARPSSTSFAFPSADSSHNSLPFRSSSQDWPYVATAIHDVGTDCSSAFMMKFARDHAASYHRKTSSTARLDEGSVFLGSSHTPARASSKASLFQVTSAASSASLATTSLPRKETSGTGVFLPRVYTASANYRRKHAVAAYGVASKTIHPRLSATTVGDKAASP